MNIEKKYKLIHTYIKDLIYKSELNQKDVAELIGMKPPTFNHILRNHTLSSSLTIENEPSFFEKIKLIISFAIETFNSKKKIEGLGTVSNIEDIALEQSKMEYREFPNQQKNQPHSMTNRDIHVHRKRKAFVKGFLKGYERGRGGNK